jgi:uncharacterized protein GlcG (DUF336 family)
MHHLRSVAAGICALFVVAASAHAQGVVTQRSLSLSLARTVADAALAECKAKGFSTSVVVVDRAGQILVMLRDEQAGAHTLEMARRKAYTSLIFRMTSAEFQKRSGDPAFAAWRDLADTLALGGGVPIRIANETIGAVASSGSSQEQDEACARVGIARIADLLK